jgi:thymidine kinase
MHNCTQEGKMNGRIEVLTGPMFAGKSDELLRRINRLKYSKKSASLFKPALDTRYSVMSVVTHAGTNHKAIPVSKAKDILEEWSKNPTNVVAIDEAQFFSSFESPSLVEVCKSLASKGVRVILAGLDMDSFGKGFGSMPELMSIADDVVKLKACCSVCGEDANMTFHKSHQASLVELGGSETYEARCRIHWENK